MATDLSTAREPTADLARIAVVHAVVVAVPVLVLGVILVPLWLAPIVAIVVAVASAVSTRIGGRPEGTSTTSESSPDAPSKDDGVGTASAASRRVRSSMDCR